MGQAVWIIWFLPKNTITALVEAKEGASTNEVIRAWTASQGLGPASHKNYRADYCPVTTWGEVVRANLPMWMQ